MKKSEEELVHRYSPERGADGGAFGTSRLGGLPPSLISHHKPHAVCCVRRDMLSVMPVLRTVMHSNITDLNVIRTCSLGQTLVFVSTFRIISLLNSVCSGCRKILLL